MCEEGDQNSSFPLLEKGQVHPKRYVPLHCSFHHLGRRKNESPIEIKSIECQEEGGEEAKEEKEDEHDCTRHPHVHLLPSFVSSSSFFGNEKGLHIPPSLKREKEQVEKDNKWKGHFCISSSLYSCDGEAAANSTGPPPDAREEIEKSDNEIDILSFSCSSLSLSLSLSSLVLASSSSSDKSKGEAMRRSGDFHVVVDDDDDEQEEKEGETKINSDNEENDTNTIFCLEREGPTWWTRENGRKYSSRPRSLSCPMTLPLPSISQDRGERKGEMKENKRQGKVMGRPRVMVNKKNEKEEDDKEKEEELPSDGFSSIANEDGDDETKGQESFASERRATITTPSPPLPLPQTGLPFPSGSSSLFPPFHSLITFHRQRYEKFVEYFFGLSSCTAAKEGRHIRQTHYTCVRLGRKRTSSGQNKRCRGEGMSLGGGRKRMVTATEEMPRHTSLAVEGDPVFIHLVQQARTQYTQKRLIPSYSSSLKNIPSVDSFPSCCLAWSIPTPHCSTAHLPNARCVVLYYGFPQESCTTTNRKALTAHDEDHSSNETKYISHASPATASPPSAWRSLAEQERHQHPQVALLAVVTTSVVEKGEEIRLSYPSYLRCLDEVQWYTARHGGRVGERGGGEEKEVWRVDGVQYLPLWPPNTHYYHGIGARSRGCIPQASYPFTLLKLATCPAIGEKELGVYARAFIPYATCFLYGGPVATTAQIDKWVHQVMPAVASSDQRVKLKNHKNSHKTKKESKPRTTTRTVTTRMERTGDGKMRNMIEEEKDRKEEEENEEDEREDDEGKGGKRGGGGGSAIRSSTVSVAKWDGGENFMDDTYALALLEDGRTKDEVMCFGQGLARYINHRYNLCPYGNVELCSISLSVLYAHLTAPPACPFTKTQTCLPSPSPPHSTLTTTENSSRMSSSSSLPRPHLISIPFFMTTKDIPCSSQLLAVTYGEDYDAKLERLAVASQHLVPYMDAAVLNCRCRPSPKKICFPSSTSTLSSSLLGGRGEKEGGEEAFLSSVSSRQPSGNQVPVEDDSSPHHRATTSTPHLHSHYSYHCQEDWRRLRNKMETEMINRQEKEEEGKGSVGAAGASSLSIPSSSSKALSCPPLPLQRYAGDYRVALKVGDVTWRRQPTEIPRRGGGRNAEEDWRRWRRSRRMKSQHQLLIVERQEKQQECYYAFHALEEEEKVTDREEEEEAEDLRRKEANQVDKNDYPLSKGFTSYLSPPEDDLFVVMDLPAHGVDYALLLPLRGYFILTTPPSLLLPSAPQRMEQRWKRKHLPFKMDKEQKGKEVEGEEWEGGRGGRMMATRKRLKKERDVKPERGITAISEWLEEVHHASILLCGNHSHDSHSPSSGVSSGTFSGIFPPAPGDVLLLEIPELIPTKRDYFPHHCPPLPPSSSSASSIHRSTSPKGRGKGEMEPSTRRRRRETFSSRGVMGASSSSYSSTSLPPLDTMTVSSTSSLARLLPDVDYKEVSPPPPPLWPFLKSSTATATTATTSTGTISSCCSPSTSRWIIISPSLLRTRTQLVLQHSLVLVPPSMYNGFMWNIFKEGGKENKLVERRRDR